MISSANFPRPLPRRDLSRLLRFPVEQVNPVPRHGYVGSIAVLLEEHPLQYLRAQDRLACSSPRSACSVLTRGTRTSACISIRSMSGTFIGRHPDCLVNCRPDNASVKRKERYGKGEVVCSIHTGSSIRTPILLSFCAPPCAGDIRQSAERCRNVPFIWHVFDTRRSPFVVGVLRAAIRPHASRAP